MLVQEVFESDLTAKELFTRALESKRHMNVDGRVLAQCLLRLQDDRLYGSVGYPSMRDCAERGLDLDRREWHRLVAVAKKLREVPQLDKAFADGEISWTSLCLIAHLVTPSNCGDWIEKVRWMTTRQVKMEVRRRRNGLRGTLSSRVRTCRTTPRACARRPPCS
ncbi:MAG: DUF222 domain-containing protein [Candidatus Eisenbacteria bacterium]|nr:DUF222 domain-containing protein [Candidatus Eisenbacteria bacterium]